MKTTAFVPRHFPRTKLPSGRALSDAQQHQYDVLRSVGGKLASNRFGWWRLLSDTHRERIYGLNSVAMWKLVELGLVVCVDDPRPNGYLFLLPDLANANDNFGPRYARQGQIAKEVPGPRQCRACDGDGSLAIDSDLRGTTPHNERLTRDSRVCTYCDGTGVSRERTIAP